MRFVGAVGVVASLGAGVLSAIALAGCGGSNTSALQGSTERGVSASRPSITQTRAESSVTPTRPATTETPSESVATVTETRPGVTVSQSTTVGVTVTGSVQPTPQTTAAAPAAETGSTPTWVWVLIAVGAGLVIGLVVWLLRRRSTDRQRGEQQRLVAATVAGWTAQGWAIESQTESSALLRRDGEAVVVSVEPGGRISSRRFGTSNEPSRPGSGRAAGPPTGEH
jgi:hypothetical protein